MSHLSRGEQMVAKWVFFRLVPLLMLAQIVFTGRL